MYLYLKHQLHRILYLYGPRRAIVQHRSHKKQGTKFACLTAYDASLTKLMSEAGVELILVGDSLGSALYNYNTTRKVTLDMMIEHAKSVRQGVVNSLLVVDMPYM